MPWGEATTVDHRVQLLRDYLRLKWTLSELCRRYGVSRKTGHKCVGRFMQAGPDGLLDLSHAPRHSPHRKLPEVERALVELRNRHPTWGPKKLLVKVASSHLDWSLPHRGTGSAILKRNGLVQPSRTKRAAGHPGRPMGEANAPNAIWCVDFKGHFRLGNGRLCYPLKVTDQYRRYLLGCKALEQPNLGVMSELKRLFRGYGLPSRIRSDNGAPFAAATLGRLSQLSVWWLKLDIHPELIQPGKPQQNRRHERMHRTLKAETTQPAASSQRGQQRKFNLFREEFNHDRPHEALDMEVPGALYTASARGYPTKLEPREYPDRFETRYVSANGGIRWRGCWVNLSSVLDGEYVGLEEIEDGEWDIYFGTHRLGRLHERLMRVEDEHCKVRRKV